MTINQKAALQTLAIIVALVGVSAGTAYILSLLGPAAPGIAGCILLLGVFVYLTFGIVKNRLEYQQKLEELNQK